MHALASLVARRYYLEDVTKSDIGRELNISRFKVARYLNFANESGIVTITINDNPRPQDVLAARLRRDLGLVNCLVISPNDPENARQHVAAGAAAWLTSNLRPHDVLGLSWGRTLAAMTGFLGDLPPARIVQLTGSVGSDLAVSPIEVMRQATARSGGEAYPIMAPLLADNQEAARTIRRQPDISRTIEAFANLTLAVVSVGSWEPTTSQLRGYLSAAEEGELAALGVEGEVAGIFLRSDGEVLNASILKRMIGVSAAELRRVPQIVVVAEGAAKAATVLAATRAKLTNNLIIDLALATELASLTAEQTLGGETADQGE